MTFRLLCGLAAGVALSLVGCKAQLLRHDPEVAASIAKAFLTEAVVRQDYAAAYAMFRLEDRRTLSQEQFAQVVKGAHPDGFPSEVHAVEFEPVPGRAAMQVFLQGSDGTNRAFYYRVPVVGTVTSGYAPQGLFRGNMPAPASALRQRLKR